MSDSSDEEMPRESDLWKEPRHSAGLHRVTEMNKLFPEVAIPYGRNRLDARADKSA